MLKRPKPRGPKGTCARRSAGQEKRGPETRAKEMAGNLYPCHFQCIPRRGACGKTRVVTQNRRRAAAASERWRRACRIRRGLPGRAGKPAGLADRELGGLRV